MPLLKARSETVIRTSREAVWRHLTRVSEWPRWYPGLYGVHATESMTGKGYRWRSTGQMGRLLYRANSEVTGYRMLDIIEIEGDRRPWISRLHMSIAVEPSGPNCRVLVEMSAATRFGFAGRLLLGGVIRRRLEAEADQITDRLRSYVERSLPHH